MTDEGEPAADRLEEFDLALELEHVFRTSMPELAKVLMIGRFEAFRRIGRGGFGVVYLARDPELDRVVAVKLCRSPQPERIEAFKREAQILARFSHPNIVAVHEVGWHGHDFFYAMEFIEGCDGAKYRSRAPDWRQVLEVYLAAAMGLAAAHAKGVVHGDFKPANVLIGNDGRVCVADFGLARSFGKADRDDTSGPWAATLPYMAPELFVGGQPDAGTDQWAWFVSLWETLFRRRPSGKLRVPRGAPELPSALLGVLRRGLSVDRSDRYPSMQAVIEALEEIRSPMVTLPVSESIPAASGRPWWVSFVQGMAVSLVVCLALVFGVRGRVENPEAPATKPVEIPCALGDDVEARVELDPTVIEVCQLIRDGHFNLADAGWAAESKDRFNRGTPGLGEHTLIIARTFVEQAEAIQQTMPEEARAAAWSAQGWVPQSAALLGGDDLRVQDVKARAETISPPASTAD